MTDGVQSRDEIASRDVASMKAVIRSKLARPFESVRNDSVRFSQVCIVSSKLDWQRKGRGSVTEKMEGGTGTSTDRASKRECGKNSLGLVGIESWERPAE